MVEQIFNIMRDGTENEGQALNVLAYGDVVEEAMGHRKTLLKQQKL